VLRIEVFGHGNLSNSVRVQEDGRIRLPLCGWVDAAGLTVSRLSEKLSEAYQEENIEQAFVTVFLTSYGPRTAYVIGEVLQGGIAIEIVPFSRLTAFQAVSSAGGFTPQADLRNIVVRRTAEAGEITEIEVDALAIIAGEEGASDPQLRIGDTVVVPRKARIFIFGEVRSPGEIQTEPGVALTAFRAITMRGGFTEYAKEQNVRLIRGGQTQTLDLRSPYGKKGIQNDPELQPGDILFVETSMW
jgi:polysaccharide export outer membrane protein